MRKVIPYVLILVAVTIGYFSFEWAVEAMVHNQTVVTVPDLNGKNVTDALNLLAQTHLALIKDGEQFDKSHPAGTIIRQNPPVGMSVREGRVVRITLSQGGETLFVPDLVNQPLRNAQTSLQNEGLSIGEIERKPSLRYDKDQVVSTDPPAGASISKNAIVNVVVSDGAPAGDVQLLPDFIGKTISDVNSWAAAHQLPVSVREENDPNRAQGEILMQAPTADTPVKAGDELTIVVNNQSGAAGPHVHYEVPAGQNDSDIRILITDEAGDHEVYRKAQAPGSVIDFPVQARGKARVRVFVNGVTMKDEALQ